MEGGLIRGRGFTLPGCGETLTFSGGATPAETPAPMIGRGWVEGGARSKGLGLRKRCIESKF